MKFLFKLILFLTIASVVCMMTLPERNAHLRSVSEAIVESIYLILEFGKKLTTNFPSDVYSTDPAVAPVASTEEL